ncbi:LapA family protein [Tessaracoccus sp. G1721]
MSDTQQTGGSFLRSPRTWVGVAVAVLAGAFIVQNRQIVGIELLAFTFQAPLWITLSGVFLAGVATCWLISRRRG